MNIIIREATPSDAEQIITYMQRLSEEPGSNIEISPGEFMRSVAEEKEILSGFAHSDTSIFLVAEADGKIVGVLNCKGSPRKAIRHAVSLGVSVDQTWRRKGIGAQLMAHALAWAKNNELVSRIELSVFERNTIAIHLYQKCGFVIEGKRRRAIFRDGVYLDNLIMALLL